MFSLDGLLAYSKLNLINVSHPHNNSKGENGKDVAASDTYLLQVHGRTPLTTYGTQVALKAASLNTNDCFVLVTPKGNWISQFFSINSVFLSNAQFLLSKIQQNSDFPSNFQQTQFFSSILNISLKTQFFSAIINFSQHNLVFLSKTQQNSVFLRNAQQCSIFLSKTRIFPAIFSRLSFSRQFSIFL